MQCKKCGNNINLEQANFCNNCGEKIDNTEKHISINDQSSQKYLIMGILLAFLCSMPFGIAVILLNELKYKPHLRANNQLEANKTEKTMKVLLVLGLVFGILVNGLSFFLEYIISVE